MIESYTFIQKYTFIQAYTLIQAYHYNTHLKVHGLANKVHVCSVCNNIFVSYKDKLKWNN